MAQLCGENAAQSIQTAQAAVEGDLRAAFDDIRNLQTSPDYLQNVDKIQQRSQDLEVLLNQRNELIALEQCTSSCTCSEEQSSAVEQYVTENFSGMPLVPSLLIIALAISGFILAWYLGKKKKAPEPMVCPLKGDCSSVIKSEFSTFFGIGVEKIGMAYYILTALVYAAFLIFPALVTPATTTIAVAVSLLAFLFSLYLTFIQIGFLKQICTWCLLSALFCTVIFFAALLGSNFAFIQFLQNFHSIILILHLAGLALGVGGAIVTDVFFFKFVKDLRITESEADIMRTVSQIIWFGLGLLIISGAGLYLSDMEALNQSSKFLTKMIVVAVILVNGSFLNLKVTPKLIHISFGDDPKKTPEQELQKDRRIAFALGAISMVSWYSALILGALPSIPLSFPVLVAIYAALLACAVLGSQITERRFARKIMSNG